MDTSLVSVIIPTHNRANLISRSINSVLSQTYPDFELIVVSDGSTDNTEEIVKSCKDSRIQFLKHNESRGASAARNTGMQAARGKYIAFLDDDDEWTLNKLELQVNLLENSSPEVGLVYAWMQYIYQGQPIKLYAPQIRGYVFSKMLDRQAIGGCPTIMIKRDVLNTVKGFDEELSHANDNDFIRRVTKLYHVDFVPEVLAIIYLDSRDRLSIDSPQRNIKIAKEYEKRLQLFKSDFELHRGAWSNVLYQLGRAYIKAGQVRLGLTYMWQAIQKNPLNMSIYLAFPLAIGRRLLGIKHPET